MPTKSKVDEAVRASRNRQTRSRSRYTTPALDKGLDILELFASTAEELSKREVARRLGRGVSEIFRMLVCLETRGYLVHTPETDKLRLTLKLFKMAQEYPPVNRLLVKSIPILHEVAHQINQSCHIGVVEGGQVVILAQVDAPASTGFFVKAGSTVDLMQAASGHVILAYQRPEVRARAIEEWMRNTGQPVPKMLEKNLSAIRRRGYEERASFQVTGVTNLSFPIFDDQGYAIAALSVPFLKRLDDRSSIRDVRQRLKVASERISSEIAGTHSKPAAGKRHPNSPALKSR